MKIFGIGAHRTGTTSMAKAFQLLGFNSKHYFVSELYDCPEDILVDKISENTEVLDKWDAFTDYPAPIIYKWLDQQFPGSKFVLTTRPVDEWAPSIEWLFEQGDSVWGWGDYVHAVHERLYGFKESKLDIDIAIEKYLQHNAEVIEYFQDRPEDFMHFKLGESSWSELCEFFGKELPEQDFPKINSRENPNYNVDKKPGQ